MHERRSENYAWWIYGAFTTFLVMSLFGFSCALTTERQTYEKVIEACTKKS